MNKILKNDWNDLLEEEFHKDYYKELRKLLIEEYKTQKIFPPADEIFNAFNYTAYKDVKVLILGQDPYHNYNQAHGLSFSVRDGIKIPPSLKNIYKELNDDLGIEIPKTGYLLNWAKEGIMLLNTTLTVRAHSPMSHSKIGWEIFTNRVIEILDKRDKPMVFILWGKHAQSKEKLIKNKNHLIIKGPHPSPLSAHRGFFGSKPFSRANKFLEENNIVPPSWEIGG
ncbi:MAG: uracil-DNA glycosylase [Peptoniphilaceae bacterium]